MKIGVISVTNQGDLIANKLWDFLDIKLFSKNNIEDFAIKKITEELMESYEALIFIASTGIAVRSIAPFLKGKAVDPAVLVIDSSAKFVISLASGHLGGANELTLKIANILGAQPVITTATDNLGVTAPDIVAKENNLVIDDLKKAKYIAAKLVEGKKVAFIDDKGVIAIPKGYTDRIEEAKGIVYVTNKLQGYEVKLNIQDLKLIRRNIILGIGCRRDFDTEKMQKTVREVLEENNIDIRSVSVIATAEVKKDEKAIIELAKTLNSELKIFTLEQIENIEDKYQGSDFVKKSIGVRAVCEPCVELSGGRLLTGKIRCDGMTICIGESEE
ncbi:cobalt-precorrin 5A hydrolase [Clostridium ganghwense]|uniref:Cobalt-precorrin 5A hydrolase n=1 Tax=Clostridium ganghwense TaxID=312089 RepID=A0ABT4CTC1_9CLOT|nr:cobalt-precorrin 5A hydrolase [Clostridium ganghwense]MCY6372168.1 cobalt-precorrin 5A hydrolase [Clostridium ganghwense]